MKNQATRQAFISAVLWLILGVVVGLWLALQYAFPELIYAIPVKLRTYLEFAKLRQIHVNILAFAWLSLSLVGGLFYALPHLTKTSLKYEPLAVVGVHLWNGALLIGNLGLLFGYTRGREYAEMVWPSDLFLIMAFLMFLIVVLATLARRETEKMNVAVWYLLGSLIWMPLIILLGKGLWKNFFTNPFSGYFDNVANWFLGHNILGLWFTTLGIGLAYFLIPRITHRPIYNHYLSVIGFWTLALFYPAVGAHHTLDGPIPRWLMSEATVFSVLMIIPVTTALWNLAKSISPNWHLLWENKALAFLATGLLMYFFVSLQGSFQALMFVSTYLHFSQWVPAHAMLALGGGFTFIALGAIYHILPRVRLKNWYSEQLATWHFWLSVIGISGIFFTLTAAGLIQASNWKNTIAGMHWIDATVRSVHPEMVALVVSGIMFILGQLLFGANIVLTIFYGSKIFLVTQADLVPSESFSDRVFKFEKSVPRLVVYMLLVFSFAVLTTYLVPYLSAPKIKPNATSVKLNALEAYGRKVYIREGCLWCHSQMVRPVEANIITVFRRGDIGNATPPEWYYYQNPVVFGQHRRGPDFSHVWSRWPSEFWQKEHLKDPARFNPGTWMPPFSYLSAYDLKALVAYLKTLR